MRSVYKSYASSLRRRLRRPVLWLLNHLGPGKRAPVIGEPIHRILLIRYAGIGDVVMILGLLGTLRQLYPSAQIDVVTSAATAPILEHSPLVDRVHISVDPMKASRTAYLRSLPALRQLSIPPYDLAILAHGPFIYQ